MVAEAQKCPASYDLLMRSHDQKSDCDLWKDPLIKRNQRYLCFTRAFPSPTGMNNVLTGLMVLSEKEVAPSGYSLLDRTIDSGDKACRKKLIYFKLSSRESTKEAITDIILLTKSKRAPEGYTLAGDVNGILLCYKLGPVPLETQAFTHASPTSSQNVIPTNLRPAPQPPVQSSDMNGTTKSMSNMRMNTLQRSDSALANNPLYDVAFQLHPKHQNKKIQPNGPVPQILHRSLNDIKSEYDYSFTIERSLAVVKPVPRKRT